MLLALLLSLLALSSQAARSVKFNDRLLCETCHALGNDASREFLKIPGPRTAEEVAVYLEQVCIMENFEGYSINPQVLAHACGNLLEHHGEEVAAALREGANEYIMCHKFLPVCHTVDYNRPGYEDAATLRSKLKKRFKLILSLTDEPNEEYQRRVEKSAINHANIAAQDAQRWFEKNNDNDNIEEIRSNLHSLTLASTLVHDVYESIQKKAEFQLFLTYKMREYALVDDMVTDVDGGSIPLELKQAKLSFRAELEAAQQWLNQDENKERQTMEYSIPLAKLRNDGTKIDLNTYAGYYEKLKEQRLEHGHGTSDL